MKALGLGVLTGVLAATIAASVVFSLTDKISPASTTRTVQQPVDLVNEELGDG
ncbi:hypothetical protein AB0I81_57230 [Nonomuraea sp. NPDC050404]|uniref:hypothetical protein n=1 Tax=Nonomuraea sp. NPDC050404 TaxID=3155783 RepID=UPI0033C8ED8D